MKTLLVFSLCSVLVSCATYNSHVASRSVAGYAKAGEDRVGGGVEYTVTYR